MKSRRSKAEDKKWRLKRSKRFAALRESAYRSSLARFDAKMDERKKQIALSLESADVCRSLGLPESMPCESRLILGHTMAMDELRGQLPNRRPNLR